MLKQARFSPDASPTCIPEPLGQAVTQDGAGTVYFGFPDGLLPAGNYDATKWSITQNGTPGTVFVVTQTSSTTFEIATDLEFHLLDNILVTYAGGDPDFADGDAVPICPFTDYPVVVTP